MPAALHFTDDPAACALLAEDPFALLVGFAIDQQVPVPKAFAGPYVLRQRAGTLEPAKLAADGPDAVLHREAGDPSLPRRDGDARARTGRGRRRGVRRRRSAHLERRGRRRRPAQANRRAARLRRDEDQVARRRAREAVRREGRARSSRPATPRSATSPRRRSCSATSSGSATTRRRRRVPEKTQSRLASSPA